MNAVVSGSLKELMTSTRTHAHAELLGDTISCPVGEMLEVIRLTLCIYEHCRYLCQQIETLCPIQIFSFTIY